MSKRYFLNKFIPNTDRETILKSRYIVLSDPNNGVYPYITSDTVEQNINKVIDGDGNIVEITDDSYSDDSCAVGSQYENLKKVCSQFDVVFLNELNVEDRLRKMYERFKNEDDPKARELREMWDNYTYQEYFTYKVLATPEMFKALDDCLNDRNCTKKYIDYPDILLAEDVDYLHYFGDILCRYISTIIGQDIIFCDVTVNKGLKGCYKYEANTELNEIFRKINEYDMMIVRFNRSISNNYGNNRIKTFEIFLRSLSTPYILYLYEKILFPGEEFPEGEYTREDLLKVIISRMIDNGTFEDVVSQAELLQQIIDDENLDFAKLQQTFDAIGMDMDGLSAFIE